MSVSMQTNLKDREPLYLNETSVDFTLIVLDKEYQNDDNAYGEFKLHLYNNMDGIAQDIIVPLK